MTIYLIRKQKNRIYKSEDIVFAISGKKLSHGEKGEPHVEGAYISITDTLRYWACAFSDRRVGIDMEELSRAVSPAVVKKLHPSEREYLAPLSPGSSEWREEFLSIWTKKESYAKYTGKGLSLGFSSFCVLEGWQESLETPLFSLKYKELMIGATEPIEVKIQKYDAPMNKTALEAGADILDMRGYSARDLKKKLEGKGYSDEDSSEAVEKLLERGFLNDGEYAFSLGRKYAAKGYSARRIEFELMKKGLSREDAAKEASKHRDGDEERALAIASKMADGRDTDDKLKAKIVRKLTSLGYDTNIVYDIIQKLN